MIAISVLDQAPRRSGGPPGHALNDSLTLARHVDGLGFHRFWIAEHHAFAAISIAAPEVVIGHVARAHAPAARGIRRRPAAQPTAAAGRRAVLHARGAVSRPHRSRDRALGGRGRRGDRRGARPPAGHRAWPRLRPPARRAALVRRRAAAARRTIRSPGCARCRSTSRCRPITLLGSTTSSAETAARRGFALRVRLAHEPGRRGAGAARLPRELRPRARGRRALRDARAEGDGRRRRRARRGARRAVAPRHGPPAGRHRRRRS